MNLPDNYHQLHIYNKPELFFFFIWTEFISTYTFIVFLFIQLTLIFVKQ